MPLEMVKQDTDLQTSQFYAPVNAANDDNENNDSRSQQVPSTNPATGSSDQAAQAPQAQQQPHQQAQALALQQEQQQSAHLQTQLHSQQQQQQQQHITHQHQALQGQTSAHAQLHPQGQTSSYYPLATDSYFNELSSSSSGMASHQPMYYNTQSQHEEYAPKAEDTYFNQYRIQQAQQAQYGWPVPPYMRPQGQQLQGARSGSGVAGSTGAGRYNPGLTSYAYSTAQVPMVQVPPPSSGAGNNTTSLSTGAIPQGGSSSAASSSMAPVSHPQYPLVSTMSAPPLGSFATAGGASHLQHLQQMYPTGLGYGGGQVGAQQQQQQQLQGPTRSYSLSAIPQGQVRAKRTRRKRNEVERLYFCNYKDCTKGYGSLSHLNGHIVKHGHGKRRHPEEFLELRKFLKEREERNRQ